MSEAKRRSIALVTAAWGNPDDDVTSAGRLLAGAAAQHGEVEIVHLASDDSSSAAVTHSLDSIFRVWRVPVRGARPLRQNILAAALAGGTPGAFDAPRPLSAPLAALARRDRGDAPGLRALLGELAPDTVVLVGRQLPFDPSILEHGRSSRPIVCYLPFTSEARQLEDAALRAVLERADIVCSMHPGEQRALGALVGDKAVPFDLALPLNRGATTNSLFGVRLFGPYVVLMRGFPPHGPRALRSVTHELLVQVLGGMSVAEVDGEAWRVTDGSVTLELPVNTSRVNLWRLMAHAIATIDVRPHSVFGREALESMMLGTPVVVPDDSPSKEQAKAAGGGLWYRDAGELFDLSRVLLEPSLRDRLGAQGRRFTTARHGDMDGFVARVGRLLQGDAS